LIVTKVESVLVFTVLVMFCYVLCFVTWLSLDDERTNESVNLQFQVAQLVFIPGDDRINI